MASRLAALLLVAVVLFAAPLVQGSRGGSRRLLVEKDNCLTLWEALSQNPDYSYQAEALANNGLDAELDREQLRLTLLAAPNSVWESVLAAYKLDPSELQANSTVVAAHMAFHIAQGTIFYSTIERAVDIKFSTLLKWNKLQFNYRNESSSHYVSGFMGKSLLRTFKDADGETPTLCSGRIYKIDDIMLPDMSRTEADVIAEEGAQAMSGTADINWDDFPEPDPEEEQVDEVDPSAE